MFKCAIYTRYTRRKHFYPERKAVTIKYYESWDFDADGKIWLTQIFGDVTAAMQALNDM